MLMLSWWWFLATFDSILIFFSQLNQLERIKKIELNEILIFPLIKSIQLAGKSIKIELNEILMFFSELNQLERIKKIELNEFLMFP